MLVSDKQVQNQLCASVCSIALPGNPPSGLFDASGCPVVQSVKPGDVFWTPTSRERARNRIESRDITYVDEGGGKAGMPERGRDGGWD